MGYNPDDPEQFEKAMDIYEEFGILPKDLKTYTYLCLMSQSLLPEELQTCYNNNKPGKVRSGGLFLHD